MKNIFGFLVALSLIMSSATAFAQKGVSVKGSVVDSGGQPIIGANILEKDNPMNGAVTDLDGNFLLTLTQDDSTIEVSYIGFTTQSSLVGSRTQFDIVLQDDAAQLDEVVVVGYGVQKKKLVTGATSQVSKDDLINQSSAGLFSSMQSKVTGVAFSASSGMPGSSESIVIRGLGTIGDASPLYVIDGVAGADFSLVNAADIESIDILKDAASAAIYGSRAANGVVLVTTKRGKSGNVEVRYDGYYAIQNISKRIEVCDAKEYMELYEEYYEHSGITTNWSDYIPQYILDGVESGEFTGSDWFGAMENKNAPMQSHSVSISGGNDMSRFSSSYTYFDQEGIFGAPCEPSVVRHNARFNTDNTLLRKNDLDVVSFSSNLIYSHTKTTGVSTGDRFNNNIRDVLLGNPLMPIYNSEGEYYADADMDSEGWYLNTSQYNPIGKTVDNAQNYKLYGRLFANAALNIQPIKGLVFKSSFGYKMNNYNYRSFTPEYYYGDKTTNEEASVTQTSFTNHAWTWENTANYKFDINTAHSFDVILGQSLEKSGYGSQMSATNINFSLAEDFDYAWLSNTSGIDTSYTKVSGYGYEDNMLSSVFGRVMYNYNETYLFTAMMRADGSSKFAEGNRWGYFPSVSAGWVISNEQFLSGTKGWLNFLKLRASWGQNGNCSIDNFQYLATVGYENDARYYLGTDKTTTTQGAYATSMANVDVTWETSEQLDFGFDASFFGSRLSATFDYYIKTTRDWLVEAPIPGSYGISEAYVNGGDIQNKGVELGLTWRDRIGEFGYSISANASYNKNKVLRIANDEGVIYGADEVLYNNSSYFYKAEEGMPIGYYYGYVTDGIYQTQTEVDESLAKMDSAQPGDFRYKDLNGDNQITDEDKTEIGNPFPDVTGGLNLSLNYKGWDFSVSAKYALGLEIASAVSVEPSASVYSNWTQYVYDNRWTGEGTSNTQPSIYSNTNYLQVSDFHIHDADYLKIQNITLGFDLKNVLKSVPCKKIRIYGSLQNWFTFTSYDGFDPEVGYGGDDGWTSGIDLGYYPTAKSVVFGANIVF